MVKPTMDEQHQVHVDFCYFMPFLEVAKTTEGMVVGTYLLREKYRKSSSMQGPWMDSHTFRGEVMEEIVLC